MREFKLAPSILSADFSTLGADIQSVDEAGAEYIHIDVMDGHFVPNISFGIPVIKTVRKCTSKVFDVHLMVDEPDSLIPEFVKAGADILTVHVEACTHVHRTVQLIKSLGVKAAVALNPATPLSEVQYLLDDVDMILIMTVNPGFGNQSYIPGMTEKIAAMRQMIIEHGRDIDIQVDGGIGLSNLAMVLDAGANVIVSGSQIFKGDVASNVKAFKSVMNEYKG